MTAAVKRKIKGSTILITGGTGSFGKAVVASLLDLSPKRIIIFSRDEKKQFDMRNKFDSPLLKFIIGDVRNRETITKAMQGVDYVFHAAALKQVPTCEFFPMEALQTNTLGSYNVISAAIENEVKNIVVLSTDKAAYPINVLGMTKALMEKIMVSEAKIFESTENSKTILCGVRYGNVLYTRGSVVPYFVDQIQHEKELSVTHPMMTRFLLPLSDAIGLVLFALTEGENGYMYVRKSPSATLRTLAKAVCQIFNYSKGYKEVGIRAGEKMHETLVTEEEMLRAKEIGRYFKIPPESQGLDYNKYFFRGKLSGRLRPSFTSANTRRLNVSQTTKLLLKLPEILEERKRMKIRSKKAI